jgi:hypothetical protein
MPEYGSPCMILLENECHDSSLSELRTIFERISCDDSDTELIHVEGIECEFQILTFTVSCIQEPDLTGFYTLFSLFFSQSETLLSS